MVPSGWGNAKGIRKFCALLTYRKNGKPFCPLFISVSLTSLPHNRRLLTGGVINTPTQLIVKCVSDTYKSKNFSKIKWDCINNDILKNLDKFHVKEILKIVSVVSRLHSGKSILTQFIPVLKGRLCSMNYDQVVRIMSSYIKANIKDDLFYVDLCAVVRKCYEHVAAPPLINLLFNINMSNVKNDNIRCMERELLDHLTGHIHLDGLATGCSSGGQCEPSGKGDPTKEGKNNSNANKLEEEDEKYISHTNLHDMGKYDLILFFYSFSNYVFMDSFKSAESCSPREDFARKLKRCHDAVSKASQANEQKLLRESTPFYLFLLYKAILNEIYILEEEATSTILLDRVKDKIDNIMGRLHNRENSSKKGKTNEIVKYINMLQQNLFLYSQNKRNFFLCHFETNLQLVKQLLSLLQESNNSDMNRYYLWHREKVQEVQKIIRLIEME
ncbi:hypothetical protein C922_00772 [Plasmodium inui San Antonio 1]|uniref:Uncharacterized protein n=1 Tax=Plasmodium inui San Antonio 1 TaxID=1237626 RepID=W7ABN2_9APIC|nr:hypothetical protein C922_00772 [Plasmodium inui San Antonio 1]EUD69080.1 hypothetical protein C922_00772 [Plasmodium inui San Antonio 1]